MAVPSLRLLCVAVLVERERSRHPTWQYEKALIKVDLLLERRLPDCRALTSKLRSCMGSQGTQWVAHLKTWVGQERHWTAYPMLRVCAAEKKRRSGESLRKATIALQQCHRCHRLEGEKREVFTGKRKFATLY